MTHRVAEQVLSGFLAEVEARPGLAAVVGGLLDRLTAAGGGACLYACGGLVRDLALAAARGLPVDLKDVDLVVSGVDDSLLHRELQNLRARLPAVRGVERVGASFPVWKVAVNGLDKPVDVAVVRTRGTFGAGRGYLAEGSTALTIADDARHRDFTLNAMYIELELRGALRGRLIDLHGGLDAIAAGEIRCVGEAADRFAEDPLRMLRAVRFAATLPGFAIVPEVAGPIRERAADIRSAVAADRLADELYRALAGNPALALELLSELGLAGALLPELVELGGNGLARATRRLQLLAEEVGGRPGAPLLFAAVLLDLAEPAELPPPPFWSSMLRARRVGQVARGLHLPDLRAIERLAAGAQVLRYLDRLECLDATLEEVLGRGGEGPEVVSLYRAAERADGRQPVDVQGRLVALPESALDFGALVERLGLPAGPRLGRLRLALRQLEIDGDVADDEAARRVLGRLSG